MSPPPCFDRTRDLADRDPRDLLKVRIRLQLYRRSDRAAASPKGRSVAAPMRRAPSPGDISAVVDNTPVETEPPLFENRREAGELLAGLLDEERGTDAVVVGLARGGVAVAAEVARVLGAPLDAVAVRKIGHPWQPEYAIGAVAPGDGVYVRSADGLTEQEVAAVVEATRAKAAALDRRLHAKYGALDLVGKPCVLVDDGLATGATMIAAVRWARSRGASRTVVAVPLGAAETVDLLREEADCVVCPHPLDPFFAVGLWYEEFGQVDDDDVVRMLDETREPAAIGAGQLSL